MKPKKVLRLLPKEILKYLTWTFGIAWAMQFLVFRLFQQGSVAAGQSVLSLSMFAPMLGVVLSGSSLKNMGWKFSLRKNIRSLLAAWFLPALLTALGALLYFAVFPDQFSLSGEYLIQSTGPQALEQLQAQGLSYGQYILLTTLSAVIFAPFLNMLFAAGEEAGWRGFLYPALKAEYGPRKGLILGGIIWGIWHWPIIGLIGYEYGTGYFGYPVTGMLLFCFITTAVGIFCSWLYEKSGSIWYPALFHGSFNAVGTIPYALCTTLSGNMRLLGPGPVGVLGALPLLVSAYYLLMYQKKD